MSVPAAARQPGFTIKGWHVLAGMIGFFGTIIAVNIVFISLAVGSFPGESMKKAYVQGLEYDEVLEARAEQARIGWTAVVNLDVDHLLLAVEDEGGLPVGGLSLAGVLQHPADMALDHPLVFTEVRPGVYSADVAGLGEGLWRLEAHAEGQTPFEVRSRLWRR